MARFVAGWLNTRGNRAAHEGKRGRALRFYTWAARCDARWSVPWFNLGLHTKYQGRWHDSLRFNQRAVQLNDEDEGAWWNLGIAATALKEWEDARRAWRRLGIYVPDGHGEWTGSPVTACVRLNPDNDGEVVWGERLDPARLLVLNVPLPESGRRFKDIVLNDGATNGVRVIDGVEVPVFDELELSRASTYSTYEVTIEAPSANSESLLVEMCNELGLGVEDWSTIRWLCEECSRGNPGPHDCKAGDPAHPMRAYAIAAKTEDEVRDVLNQWVQRTEARCQNIKLLVSGG